VITLVLGGARSGKSAIAERLAASSGGAVTYVATLLALENDDDLTRRIDEHRRRRPPTWRTVEAGRDLVASLSDLSGTVLIDSLGPWLGAHGNVDATSLCDALVSHVGDVIIVSDEVGLGVHPSSHVGREFRDGLGALNQAVAACADVVLLVVAGLALTLKGG
jgi:adenosylcobinamide kinase / adenosylcobinamide-phosphate guanylyltransferase